MRPFDPAELRRHLVVKEAMRPITAKRVLERLLYAQRNGLDLDGFSEGEQKAEKAGETYLERRLETAGVHAYNNDIKALNALARYYDYSGLRFKKRKEPKSIPRALTQQQIRLALSYNHRVPDVSRFRRALVMFALETGMRVSEIAAMDLDDLDPVNSRIQVNHPAKGGQRRWLPLPAWIWSPKRPLALYLKHRQVPPMDSRALWTTSWAGGGRGPARRVDPNYMRQTMWRISQDLGFRINFNITRHTKATELRRRGVDLLYIKFFLGHASVKSTEIYAEISPEDVALLFKRKPTPDHYRAQLEEKSEPAWMKAEAD